MRSKGAIRFFAIVFAVVCLYQLSFTLVTYLQEEDARAFANGDIKKEKQFLDSIANEEVYNLGVKGFSYLECKEREINLGLDLKGGMNVTLAVSVPDLIRSLSNNNQSQSFNAAMKLAEERYKSNSEASFVDLFAQAFNEVAPNDRLAAIFANKDNKNKLAGNASNEEVIKYIRTESDKAIDVSFEILRARIDKFGVTQPNIQKLGNTGRILVELPGVSDPKRVRKLLQGTAKLEFWETYNNAEFNPYFESINKTLKMVLAGEETASTDSSTTADSTTASTDSTKTGNSTKTAKNEKADTSTAAKDQPLFKYLLPFMTQKGELIRGAMIGYVAVKDTAKINGYLNHPKVKAVLPGDMRFLWSAKPFEKNKSIIELYAIKSTRGQPILGGDCIVDAQKDVTQTGSIEVTMQMNSSGASSWARITEQAANNKNACIAIVLDDAVYSAPSVRNKITGGRSSIEGNFTNEEASDLANILKAGKMPAPAYIVGEDIVGPTLGQEAITAGLLSFLIALILVLVFMAVYYNRAGLVADVALLANMFFIMGVLASLGAVLTLPGIAGIVLTIGLSVDANILIFERIREELAHGKASPIAIRDGFKHAMSSILDSNITTLILGIILYSFGSGPIQGFATTLIVGICTSLFSAIFIARLIFERQLAKGKEIPFASKFSEGAFKNITINWVGKRRLYYIISGSIIVAGIISAVTRGFNFGVDFKGGRTYKVEFQNEVKSTEIRDVLTPVFGSAPEVKTIGTDGRDVKITTTYRINETSPTAGEEAETKLNEGLKTFNNPYEIKSSATVGPTIASDISASAIKSILFSCILMFLFILLRFRKWQYGLGATVALFHDVFIVLSFFTLLNGVVPFALEIDQAFIAALLTVMSYSMTDTVVVFDRIREYLSHKKKDDLDHHERETIINYALNSTLSRTINTSLTIFFVLLAIFIFGGEVIRGFSFSLLIGIVIGTYSSICIATPIVVDFQKKDK